MKPKILLIMTLLLGLLGGTPRADNAIEVIELKGRTAEEIIPLIKPMLSPGAGVSGRAYQLILRTDPANLEQIRALVAQLDQVPKRLLITVHIGELSSAERQAASLHARHQQGDVEVAVGSPAPGPGARIEHRSTDTAVGARVHGTRALRDAGNRQQVQTLEGEPAYVAAGVAYPYISHVETYSGGIERHAAGIDYRETRTGFYVLAQLRDDQVLLDVSPQKEALSRRHSGAIESTHLSTRIMGPIGDWIALGGSGATSADRQGDYTSRHRTRDRDSQQIWIRVQVLE